MIFFNQNEFGNLDQNPIKDEIIRSMAGWAENREKNTNFFLNLEKNYDKKVIHKLNCGKDFF